MTTNDVTPAATTPPPRHYGGRGGGRGRGRENVDGGGGMEGENEGILNVWGEGRVVEKMLTGGGVKGSGFRGGGRKRGGGTQSPPHLPMKQPLLAWVTSDSEPHLTLFINTHWSSTLVPPYLYKPLLHLRAPSINGHQQWSSTLVPPDSNSHFFTSELLLLLAINTVPRLWCLLTLPATSSPQNSFYQWPSTQFLDFSACRPQSSSTSLPQTFFLQ
ncbi:hypothetical protein Pmani_032559 [Petrolisthes manimaculis]|uniref:Uncharacterized protein n=1 Tax=Petrolisthes manimaculis TaxID=1843537 RepID=A0AAE1NTF3_9EUCA|nr:hypothetical protein Pmani_032559 [Petrolisthes manimaculis]